MITPTHIVFGVTTYLALGNNSATGLLVAAASSVIPDIDTRQSLLGKALPLLSGPISYHFVHRTITHSLGFQVFIGVMAYIALPADYVAAVVCGLVSHAFADMLTLSGVCWFWPSRVRCVLPGSAKYRFETGSWAELVFACVMAALSFGFVWIHNSTVGTAGVIRSAIDDIAAARQQYDEEKGSFAFKLRMTGSKGPQKLDSLMSACPYYAAILTAA